MNYAEVIALAIGAIDGFNRDFRTHTPFVSGTPRAVVNGLIYNQEDEQFGLVELSGDEVRLNVAPKTGFNVQFFYREIPVDCSPFDPDGVLP